MLGAYVPIILQNLGTGTVVYLYNDLLSALIAYLQTTPLITNLITAGYGQGGYGQLGYGGSIKVYDEIAPPSAWPPFLFIDNYVDTEPGKTLEDGTIRLTINCVANDLDSVRVLGDAVMDSVDSISINLNSSLRATFKWNDGIETGVLRNRNKPYRVAGIGKGGQYVYVEAIDYEFWVTPTL